MFVIQTLLRGKMLVDYNIIYYYRGGKNIASFLSIKSQPIGPNIVYF